MIDVLAKIVKLRDERDWTDYQLAEHSDLPQSTISSWYHKNLIPSVSSIDKVCEAFGLTLSQFFAEEGDPIDLTESQRQLLDRWARLTPEQQEAIFRLMDLM